MAIGTRPSPKQHVRLWYEFYRLALSSPAFAAEIASSHHYYEPWGDVKNTSFDLWWATHSHLFDAASVRVVEAIENSPLVIHIQVPLALAPSDAAQQVSELVKQRQTARLAEIGRVPRKSSKVGFSQFHLTPGVEFRGRSAEAALQLYRDIFLPMGSPPIGQAFAAAVTAFYRHHPRRAFPITGFDRGQESDFSSEQVRHLRRYISRANDLVRAAAIGNFPGERDRK